MNAGTPRKGAACGLNVVLLHSKQHPENTAVPTRSIRKSTRTPERIAERVQSYGAGAATGIVEDSQVQTRLLADARTGKLHPSVLTVLMAYVYGLPNLREVPEPETPLTIELNIPNPPNVMRTDSTGRCLAEARRRTPRRSAPFNRRGSYPAARGAATEWRPASGGTSGLGRPKPRPCRGSPRCRSRRHAHPTSVPDGDRKCPN